MTDGEFLPALLAALPGPTLPGRADQPFDGLIDAARRLNDAHAAGRAGELVAGLAVVERCFTAGTKSDALAAAEIVRLLVEFAHDRPGGSEALASLLPPVTRDVCQQVWIQQTLLSEWLDGNVPLAGECDD